MRRLSASYIQRHCGLTACVFEEVTSTNNILKEYARQGAPALTMVVAAAQSAGRGRGEHTFFSPRGTGVYLSVLLYPAGGFAPADITAAAAVAACDAVEQISGERPDIKWMNDLYMRGKKVAGILCEAVMLPERTAVVVGMGLNLLSPKGGFPEEIALRAGAVFEKSKQRFLRERAVIAFFGALEKRLKHPEGVYAAYRQGLFVLGMQVAYEGQNATVSDLLPDFRLELTFPDGEKRYLHSGEISLPLGETAQ